MKKRTQIMLIILGFICGALMIPPVHRAEAAKHVFQSTGAEPRTTSSSTPSIGR